MAVTGTQRASAAQELPILDEGGVAGYVVDGCYAMLNLAADIAKWAKVVRDAGIQPD